MFTIKNFLQGIFPRQESIEPNNDNQAQLMVIFPCYIGYLKINETFFWIKFKI